MTLGRGGQQLAAGVGLVLALGGLAVQAPAQQAPPVKAPPAQSPPPNQLAGVTLAKGTKPGNPFGGGEVTPVDPTTSFFNTDLPYAVIKVKTLLTDTDTVVTIRLSDPTGPAFAIEAKAPKHPHGVWEVFDFALPLFILGTDLETHTGAWQLDVEFNGQLQGSVSFQWGSASPIQLGKIKDLIDQNPLNPDLHWRYGAALALLHHDEEGIRELQSAIQLDRNYALYHISLGRIYERQGRTADAVRSFQTALSLHGSYYDAVYSGWAKAHLTRLQTP